MTKFPSLLNIQYIISDKKWRMLNTFSFIDKEHGEITVPVDFVSDGITLPRIPIVLALFDGYGFPAGIVHDYLYTTGVLGRKHSDEVFYRALRELGIARWRAWLMYFGVRCFGGFYYMK